MRRFSLYRRGKVWYCAWWNPVTRRYGGGRSTGRTDKNQALLEVAKWQQDGIPEATGEPRSIAASIDVDTSIQIIRSASLTETDVTRIVDALKVRNLIEYAVTKGGPSAEPLISYLKRFWNFDQSPYVKEKVLHKHRTGRRHCYDMSLMVRVYWKPYFKERRLSEVQKSDLQAFSLWLIEQKNLKPKSANNALSAGTTALRWAKDSQIISTNPAQGLMKFGGKQERRGVLEEDEVKRLFAEPWPHERAYLGNMLAMTTGMRQGEVLAVQVRDTGEDRLFVRHSWSNFDRLKDTKTGEERIPLLPDLRKALLDLARKNPNGVGPTSYVFWSNEFPERPLDAQGLLDPLHAALLKLTLSEEDRKHPEKVKATEEVWKKRRVCFHSWHHYYAARMADRLEARKVMTATGHSNGEVFRVYADHAAAETLREVEAVTRETFSKLLPFRKGDESDPIR